MSSCYGWVKGDKPPLTPEATFQPISSIDLSVEIDLWGRLRRATESAENLISLLVGRNPTAVTRGRSLLQQLVSANARIGVAKALFFP